MNGKEPLGVPAGGGGPDGRGPGAPASPPSGPAGEGAPGKQAEGRPDGNPGPEQALDRHVSRETSPDQALHLSRLTEIQRAFILSLPRPPRSAPSGGDSIWAWAAAPQNTN